jgi:D-3-phosphoglycerate dehydrogenase
MRNVLLTHGPTALRNYFGAGPLGRLESIAQVRHNPVDEPWNDDALVAAARNCDVVIADRSTPLPAEVLARLATTTAVSRCAVDIRNIDVAAASALGILVTRCSAGFMASVSEWVVGAMVELSRGIGALAAAYHRGESPVPAMGRELRGAVLGLVGYGQIARYLVEPVLALGMRVVVTDPGAPISDSRVTAVTFGQLLAQADYVVCLAAATPQTENLFDAAAFAAMKRGAMFVNASRGNLVDEPALLQALDDGRLAGCALDVGRAPDQMPSPLVARHQRVIATPHIGGLTQPAIEHQAFEVVAQVGEILQRRVPAGAVNPTAATRLARTP